MTKLKLPAIADVRDDALAQALQRRLDAKAKPPGSLGRIESLAVQVGLVQQTETPRWKTPQLVVFAADHGLAAQGVSASPSDVTWQMVENFVSGGAAVSVLARQHGLTLTVVDAGVNHDFRSRNGLIARKIARGTNDSLRGPAMTAEQCVEAVQAGSEIVRDLPGNVVLLGAMGIANTSSAALLLTRLSGADLVDCVSRSGPHDDRLVRKLRVLEAVLQRHPDACEPLDVLAAMGGFEIAMLVGGALRAASLRRVVLVDGFVAGVAVLVAARLVPEVLGYCVFSHRAAEGGHALLMRLLGAEPLLELGLRLGEGSGTALAWPLLDSAVRLLNEMASFESAGVSTGHAPGG